MSSINNRIINKALLLKNQYFSDCNLMLNSCVAQQGAMSGTLLSCINDFIYCSAIELMHQTVLIHRQIDW